MKARPCLKLRGRRCSPVSPRLPRDEGSGAARTALRPRLPPLRQGTGRPGPGLSPFRPRAPGGVLSRILKPAPPLSLSPRAPSDTFKFPPHFPSVQNTCVVNLVGCSTGVAREDRVGSSGVGLETDLVPTPHFKTQLRSVNKVLNAHSSTPTPSEDDPLDTIVGHQCPKRRSLATVWTTSRCH